uniref:NADH-ubiquinone oxidoreductase chain 6 n=1 Tax=Lagocephalus lagocephalus TaxID=546522 RepID=F2EN33_9TELE|nr:NADH dehydrogenase subunit 6 [Lagocephalus lagocephalus]WNH19759.1 NADH dehydrogenase subunit 6 [Lagocephalus lagocephalus]BAK10001.1 NADH dehydrogenase subunit 6 [Lagocephalus lagocephalus]
MTYVMSLCLLGLVVGLIAVASNPSPYFGALSLVVVAGFGCGVLVWHGGSFLSLVLFLIYLGGMLVVFAYSAALAAEPYPETLGSEPVFVSMLMYLGMVGVVFVLFLGVGDYTWVIVDEMDGQAIFRGDMSGAALMYSYGGGMLMVGGWVLLLTLLVVLELTRGLSRGGLRAV